MPGVRGRPETYSISTATAFLFNLIVGTGALALPGAVQKAGWIMGTLLIVLLGVFSYITVTYVIETLAISNALSRKRHEASESNENDEDTPLVEANTEMFDITEKFEIGQMGTMLTPKWCQFLINLCLCLYLYGDLTIYAVVIGKTAARIVCTSPNSSTITDEMACWGYSHLTRYDIYRISVVLFLIIMGPFLFCNLQKTKILQFFTCGFRVSAFAIMLLWCIYLLCKNGAEGSPPIFEISSVPILFGTLVYSFMCQHSIPGLIHPISDKSKLHSMITFNFIIIALFYLALSLTAIFTFKYVEDIYTFNFWGKAENLKHSLIPDPSAKSKLLLSVHPILHRYRRHTNTHPGLFPEILAKYLTLFPIITLSTNFPIIGVTLRNNLRTMVLKSAPYKWYYDKLLFPLVTLLPPILLALATNNLQILVGIVGSYAGSCVQYLIPCLLVIYARREIGDLNNFNCYSSFFYNKFYTVLVLLWMIICVIMISVNYFYFFIK